MTATTWRVAGADSAVEERLVGLGVSAGLAVGPVLRINPPVPIPADEPAAADLAQAAAAVEAALESVACELERRAEAAAGDGAAVLAATAMMARDSSLLAAVGPQLAAGVGPATALDAAIADFVGMFAAAGGYLAERTTDLLDVKDRAVALLLGLPAPGLPVLTEPVVIVAHDLAPAETATLDPALVLALVTEAGGVTSHTAILAAQLGIPAIVHVSGVLSLQPGTEVAVDGSSGVLVVAPSTELKAAFTERTRQRRSLLSSGSGRGRLRDGTKVALYANVGTVNDAVLAGAADVEGVGLFRTEFLFGERAQAPSLDEQVACYTSVFGAFGSRPITVRTLDAGADKPMKFAPQDAEPNPALGVRGLRLSQLRADLLDTQLHAIAIAAASTGAQTRVMAPMVATSDDAKWFAERASAAGLPTVGVMIEVPAAALRAQHVLAHVDFASIGTNDLTQYVMAADRMNGALSGLLSTWEPAVLDLIAATVAGAEAAGSQPVGVCGESAGDPLLALALVGLGVGSLSMAVSKVPAVRLCLALHDLRVCQQMAAAARRAGSAAEAKASVLGLLHPDAAPLL